MNCRIYPRSKRLQLYALHLDIHPLDGMLFHHTAALGITDLWRDDDQRYQPNRSDWFVMLERPGACFKFEAVQLVQSVGRPRILVLHPLCQQEREPS